VLRHPTAPPVAPPARVDDSGGAAGLSRRQLLYVAAGGSVVLLAAVAGETLPALERVAVLAPRRSRTGPQGVPVNRSAVDAGVHDAALDPAYRLVLDRGNGAGELSWSLDELRAMPQRRAGLPIACVEGWSAAAEWQGVQVRHLLALAGLPAATQLRFESLEQRGAYRVSVLDPDHVADPDTLLALRLHGEPLDLDHGYPLRLISPNRPGVLQTKWVSRIVVT
jgi:DMSO/TMAO reductase YedYZ molybdopterin-dependent catalytic subunit